jgi:DNA-binding beta-propeller fold protein YncE
MIASSRRAIAGSSWPSCLRSSLILGIQFMRPAVIAPLLFALSAVPALAQVDVRLDETNFTTLPLPAPGGWVLSPDGETLIVSSPKTAEIIYIDTSKEKEVKRVKVNFQPAALALRGSSLYAVAKGSSLLYVLDAQTGQSKEQIRVPGDKLVQLGLRPPREWTAIKLAGQQHRFVILPRTGSTGRTRAAGPRGGSRDRGGRRGI